MFALRFFQTPPRGDSPCVLTSPSPPSGWAGDFHPQAAERAQHTTKPLRGKPEAWWVFGLSRQLRYHQFGMAATLNATVLQEVLPTLRTHQKIQKPFLTLQPHRNIWVHAAQQTLRCHSAAACNTRPSRNPRILREFLILKHFRGILINTQ